jgi:membrane associated rhomboid family serine protease
MFNEMTLTIIIIVLTCLVSFTSFNNPQRMDELSFWPYYVKHKHQYWRFITGGFVHADIRHLAFNMLSLYFFGTAIEEAFAVIFPSKYYYLLFYGLGLILAHVPTYFKYKDVYGYRSIGASGAVSAVIFSAIIISPWSTIAVFFVPMPAIVYGVVYLGYTIYMSRNDQGSGINHDAHLWGAVFGILFPLLYAPRLIPYFLDQLQHPHFHF